MDFASALVGVIRENKTRESVVREIFTETEGIAEQRDGVALFFLVSRELANEICVEANV